MTFYEEEAKALDDLLAKPETYSLMNQSGLLMFNLRDGALLIGPLKALVAKGYRLEAEYVDSRRGETVVELDITDTAFFDDVIGYADFREILIVRRDSDSKAA